MRLTRLTSRGAPLAALSLLASPAFGQGAVADALPGSPRWFFAAVPAEPPATAAPERVAQYLQTLPAVGREDLLAASPLRAVNVEACAPYRGEPDLDVVSTLTELAAASKIVIVNEAHDTPRHRELIRQLAVALRKAGYAYFAAEAFTEAAARHPDEPFGRIDAGYYTIEPAFGALLRTVKSEGYALIAYEPELPAGFTGADAIAAREEGQASNLVTKIFAAEPSAKVLIHVGHAHAAEVPLPSFGRDIPWLAARLKSKTGIDPLTIEQTFCVARGNAVELAAPTTRMPAGAFDVAVAYPEPTFFRGRPQWRIDAGAVAIELPETLVTTDQRTIVEARLEADPPDAIPLDRLMLWPGERLPLLLPPGRVRLVQVFENGAAPRALTLNVR